MARVLANGLPLSGRITANGRASGSVARNLKIFTDRTNGAARARPLPNACDGSVKGGTMNTDTLSDQPVSPYVVHGVAGLRERAGASLGTSRWVTVDQEMETHFSVSTA